MQSSDCLPWRSDQPGPCRSPRCADLPLLHHHPGHDPKKVYILLDSYLHEFDSSVFDEKKIIIVYNVFVAPNSNWRSIICGQLYELKSYGLLNEAELHVTITDPRGIGEIDAIIREICGDKVFIHHFDQNRFEYWGIDLVWRLAQQYPDAKIAYFHTKGISYGSADRNVEERWLTRDLFRRWRRSLQAFEDPAVNKIGAFPAPNFHTEDSPWGGWIWFNFWWARASYLIGCGQPPVTGDRHYYESWLGWSNGKNRIDDSRRTSSLEKEFFAGETASFEMHKLYE